MNLFHTFPFVPTDPFSFWAHLHPQPRNGFILGSGAATPEDHIMYMSVEDPIRTHVATNQNDPLQFLKNCGYSGMAHSTVPRFVGTLYFEAGRQFDDGIRNQSPLKNPLHTPQSDFGEYNAVLKIDFLNKESKLYIEKDPRKDGGISLIKKMYRAYHRSKKTNKSKTNRTKTSARALKEFKSTSKKIFWNQVVQTKKDIQAGDIYQANLSVRFQGKLTRDPVELYSILCRKNPSPYACLIKQKSGWIISSSPELLMKLENGVLSTRPIAGTRPRGQTRRLDRTKAGQLLLSPKERAEHIMLVDLERNDLGRVCRPGSVKVTDRYAIERYSHVMHIVSEVQGQLSPKKNASDALKALFPGGTITGCPKIKSIDVISNRERVARGPFYGSAGYFTGAGDAKLNILIRTAFLQGKKVFVQAGAGIVADSNPKREYKEVLAKAQALLESITEANARQN